ncbi:MAG: alpha/beta fold hydrolase [Chloroflexi bacterium]|nr:alpha/beta fold hydrolase [Chloroflexota bacterium]
MLPAVEPVHFSSGLLTLEGALHRPLRASPFPGVVVCHPGPLQGGDMDNNVVMGVTEALVHKGVAVLRFNFRGVGGSQGVHDKGIGEVQDGAAALSFLSLCPGVDGSRLGVAGYSFGARIALAVAQGSGVKALCLIGASPRSITDTSMFQIAVPKLLISGDRDGFAPSQELDRMFEGLTGPKEKAWVAGSDHFFGGYEEVVGRLASEFFAREL